MALRPINNAPTPTSEFDRPRKQPKLSIPPTLIQKNKRSCLPAATIKNDENQAPSPQPNHETTIEFEYIASEDLKPLSDPEAKIQFITFWRGGNSSLANDIRKEMRVKLQSIG